jgi:hypothetical protein
LRTPAPTSAWSHSEPFTEAWCSIVCHFYLFYSIFIHVWFKHLFVFQTIRYLFNYFDLNDCCNLDYCCTMWYLKSYQILVYIAFLKTMALYLLKCCKRILRATIVRRGIDPAKRNGIICCYIILICKICSARCIFGPQNAFEGLFVHKFAG